VKKERGVSKLSVGIPLPLRRAWHGIWVEKKPVSYSDTGFVRKCI